MNIIWCMTMHPQLKKNVFHLFQVIVECQITSNWCLKQDWSNFSHSVSAHIAVTAPSQHSKVWSCQAMAACQRGLRATRMWYWLAPNEMSNYVGQRPILFAEPRTELTKRDIYKLSRNYDLALDNFFGSPSLLGFMPAPTIYFIAWSDWTPDGWFS